MVPKSFATIEIIVTTKDGAGLQSRERRRKGDTESFCAHFSLLLSDLRRFLTDLHRFLSGFLRFRIDFDDDG